MTTPEQLTKWREAGNAAWRTHNNPIFSHTPQTTYVCGYLRRCQETEQAIKDARKQALEESIEIADAWAMEYVIEDNATLTVGDYIKQELLND